MTYSISDLEQLSGVQSHTIRIWERRYNALEPMRSAGNTRLYDGIQLRRLLNIVSLSKSGLKISHVCSLTELEMNELLNKELDQLESPVAKYEYYISQLLSVGLAYDEVAFNALICTALDEYGLKTTYTNIMYPLLVRLGLMWRSDNICPAQEHFLSNIIRQKISAATNEIPQDLASTSTWVLFLPEDEDHDIGLLFANYLLKLSGLKVIYLGAKVPIDSLKNVLNTIKVDYLLLFMVKNPPGHAGTDYLTTLSDNFPDQLIYVAGNTRVLSDRKSEGNIRSLNSIEELENQINMTNHAN
ncbi:MAG: MerR family transcriptional regulator [Pedobacter sp.]